MEKNGYVNVELKTITDIRRDNVTFYIDAYQRGYRWTSNEVRALLDDIREFSQTEYNTSRTNNFYCLQPVILTKSDEGMKVIDGQQRLTTLFLIYIFYTNIYDNEFKRSQMPYGLSYKNKENLSTCLNELKNNRYFRAEDFEKLKSYEMDIDCYFIIEAYREICDYFKYLLETAELINQIDDMRKVFDNYMKIIWYELKDCDQSKEIDIFTKINMGKIPLTNSELIKALLLKNVDEDFEAYQQNISIKWDEIESKLLNDDFWSFLTNNDSKYSTRIDFIFEVLSHELNETILKDIKCNGEELFIDKKSNTELFSFYVINNYFKHLVINEKMSKKDCIKVVWDKLTEYYRMFSDWYCNRTWYHLIGYNVYVSKDKSIDRLYEICLNYKNQTESSGHKTYFLNKLKELTIQTISDSKFIDGMFNKKSLELMLNNYNYSDDSERIRRILLLYNLAVLEEEEKTDTRFLFNKFKNKNEWDIEHINAIADEKPYDDSDNDDNAWLVWLKSVRELDDFNKIKLKSGKKAVDIIDEIINEKKYLDKNDNGNLIDLYESVINYFNGLDNPNLIGNLTLLNSTINRSYKNVVFPLKRIRIIDECCRDYYIPLGTKKVFLKAYSKSNNLVKWTKDDFNYYIQDILDKISTYLNLEE